jgi:hypothetical protein
MSNVFEAPVNSIGAKGNGGQKSAIPEDIYEAVCIGLADAGESTSEWQGKAKTKRNIVLVWALDHVNGFGSTSLVTDWRNPSTHDNSAWTKDLITPTKIKIISLKELIGKTVRVEIVKGDNGYAQIARYFASKTPMTVPEGLYLPAWLYTKGYPLIKHADVIDGPRPQAPKADAPAQKVGSMPTHALTTGKPTLEAKMRVAYELSRVFIEAKLHFNATSDACERCSIKARCKVDRRILFRWIG